MQDLLKKYYDAQLAKYSKRMDAHGSLVAAKFALDDMASVVRRNIENYGNEADVMAILEMEIEDTLRAAA